MSAPGWYPDPDGSRQLRYFDGRQWTPQTAQPLPQGQGAGHPPHSPLPAQGPPAGGQQAGHPQGGVQQYPGSHAGAVPPHAPTTSRSHLWMWVALALIVATIIGVGSWLLFFRQSPTATPTPGATQSVEVSTRPAESPPPSDSPPPSQSTPPSKTPSPSSSEASTDLPAVGAIIEPVAGCPAGASDAIGEAGDDGRYTSGAGLSMPSAEGFTPTAVQIPWMYQSNSQVKSYDDDWIGLMAVGTLRGEDGFTTPLPSALGMVACLAGSSFYAESNPTATVIGADGGDEEGGVTLVVEMAVESVAATASDLVLVISVQDLDGVHVFVATTPTSDPDVEAVVQEVASDLSLQ